MLTLWICYKVEKQWCANQTAFIAYFSNSLIVGGSRRIRMIRVQKKCSHVRVLRANNYMKVENRLWIHSALWLAPEFLRTRIVRVRVSYSYMHAEFEQRSIRRYNKSHYVEPPLPGTINAKNIWQYGSVTRSRDLYISDVCVFGSRLQHVTVRTKQ